MIGLELGQALAHLGVAVTLLGRNDHIGHLSDPMVRSSALSVVKQHLDFQSNAQLISTARTIDGVSVTYVDDAGDTRIREFDYVLACTGRTINLANLNFATLNIAFNERGVPAFDHHTMQVENSSIFIAGDVNADVPLLHEAADDGVIAQATMPAPLAKAKRLKSVRAEVRLL